MLHNGSITLPVVLFAMLALAMLAIVIVAVLVGSAHQKQRAAALAAFAAERGLVLLSPGTFRPDALYPGFRAFRRGHSRLAEITLAGTIDVGGHVCPLVMGDYRFRESRGSGKSRRTVTVRFSYLALTLPFPAVPDLMVRREGIFDRLAGMFSDADIDFESDEFSRRYHVSGSDRKFAYDLIDRPMMDFLLEALEQRRLGGMGAVHIQHNTLLLCDPGSRWAAPGEFESVLGWADRFMRLWPEHLVRRLAERADHDHMPNPSGRW